MDLKRSLFGNRSVELALADGATVQLSPTDWDLQRHAHSIRGGLGRVDPDFVVRFFVRLPGPAFELLAAQRSGTLSALGEGRELRMAVTNALPVNSSMLARFRLRPRDGWLEVTLEERGD